MKVCAAAGCRNRESDNADLNFFPFPCDAERCLKWLSACGRRDLISYSIQTLSSNYFLCFEHYKLSEDKSQKGAAKPMASPIKSATAQSKSTADGGSIPIDTKSLSPTVCRLCSESASDAADMISLLENPLLLERINSCLPINVRPKDALPKNVCPKCWDRLQAHYEFGRLVVDSENILRQMIIDLNRKPQYSSSSVPLANNIKNKPLMAPTPSLPTPTVIEIVTDGTTIAMGDSVLEMEIIPTDSFDVNQEQNFILQAATMDDDDDVDEMGREEIEELAVQNRLDDVELECENQEICFDESDPESDSNIMNFTANISQAEGKPGECTICNKKLSDDTTLQRHVWYEHGGGQGMEPHTAAAAAAAEKRKHWHMSEINGVYGCSVCAKAFGSVFAQLVHEEQEHAAVRQCHPCPACGEAFANKEQVIEHHLSEHGESIEVEDDLKSVTIKSLLQCEYCFRLFPKIPALRNHRSKYHFDDPKFACRYCNEEFDSHTEYLAHAADKDKHLISHNKEDYPERPVAKRLFCCHYCSKYYRTLNSIIEHQGTHKLELEVVENGAEVSDKSQTTTYLIDGQIYQSDLNLKITNTTKPPPRKTWVCNVCSKEFAKKTFLTIHMRVHTGERPYQCYVCGKTFSQSQAFAKHSKLHVERPFPCSHCCQAFKTKLLRDEHEKTHSEGRPYKCEICGKNFKKQRSYNQHCKTHTLYKPHVCKTCDKAFSMPYSLRLHMLRHTGVKPHNCSVCEKNFRRKSHLQDHLKKHHGIL